jgi:hypothetical protein
MITALSIKKLCLNREIINRFFQKVFQLLRGNWCWKSIILGALGLVLGKERPNIIEK